MTDAEPAWGDDYHPGVALTRHAEERMSQRGVSLRALYDAANNPGGGNLRVVVERDDITGSRVVVTTYWNNVQEHVVVPAAHAYAVMGHLGSRLKALVARFPPPPGVDPVLWLAPRPNNVGGPMVTFSGAMPLVRDVMTALTEAIRLAGHGVSVGWHPVNFNHYRILIPARGANFLEELSARLFNAVRGRRNVGRRNNGHLFAHHAHREAAIIIREERLRISVEVRREFINASMGVLSQIFICACS